MHRSWIHGIAVAVVALLLVTACDTAGPDTSEYPFEVQAEPGQLVLENNGATVVRYVAMEKAALMFSSYDFTSAVGDWSVIDPGEQVVILNEELTGYSEEATHASVLWAIGMEYQATLEVELR